jgi:hypothetical protein
MMKLEGRREAEKLGNNRTSYIPYIHLAGDGFPAHLFYPHPVFRTPFIICCTALRAVNMILTPTHIRGNVECTGCLKLMF